MVVLIQGSVGICYNVVYCKEDVVTAHPSRKCCLNWIIVGHYQRRAKIIEYEGQKLK